MDKIPLARPAQHTLPTPKTAALHDAAVQLEATFLAEMLRSTGLGETRDAFGGGAGEEQFASFLLQAQAEKIARSGGIGLTEILFSALMEAQNDTPHDRRTGSGTGSGTTGPD